MPKHRNMALKKFVESIPQPLMKEYFEKKCPGVECLTSYDPESICRFLDGPEDEALASSICEDFSCINDVCETVMNYVDRAVRLYCIERTGDEVVDHLVMRLFLHHKQAFEYAYDY